MGTVKRSVMFFDLSVTVHNAATNTSQPPADKVKSIEDALIHISSVPFQENDPTRYYKTKDGNMLYIEVDENNQNLLSGRFIASRKRQFPDIETNGNLTPLVDNIPENAGLAEISHFIFFKNNCVLGYEFNFYAPRASALSYYIPTKANGIVSTIDVIQRLNLDADRIINETGEISLLDMSVFRNQIGILESVDSSLAAAFRAASEIADGADMVELVLRRKSYSKSKWQWPVILKKDKIKEILKDADRRTVFDRLVIKSETLGKCIDLLEDKMIIKEYMVTTDDKQNRVLSTSAYSVIKDAYDQLFT